MPRVRRCARSCTLLVACPADVDVPSFVSAIADGDLERGRAGDLRRQPARRHAARACARRELLCEGACVLVHEGREPIEIGRLQRYAADAALTAGRHASPPRGGRRAAGRRDRRGARRARLRRRARRARATRSRSTTSAHEPGGLVRYAIAPYRQQNDPLPEEARARRASSASRIVLGRRDRPREAVRDSPAMNDAVVLAVGMGADTDAAAAGRRARRRLGLAAVHRGAEDGRTAADRPERGRRSAAATRRSTCAGEAVRLGADEVTIALPAHRGGDARLPRTRSSSPATEGVRFEWLAAPVRLPRHGSALEGVECVRDAARRAGRGRAATRPEPVPGQRVRRPGRHRRSWRSASEPRREFCRDRGSSSSVDRARPAATTRRPGSTPRATPSTAAPRSSRRSARARSRPRAVDADLRGAA